MWVSLLRFLFTVHQMCGISGRGPWPLKSYWLGRWWCKDSSWSPFRLESTMLIILRQLGRPQFRSLSDLAHLSLADIYRNPCPNIRHHPIVRLFLYILLAFMHESRVRSSQWCDAIFIQLTNWHQSLFRTSWFWKMSGFRLKSSSVTTWSSGLGDREHLRSRDRTD